MKTKILVAAFAATLAAAPVAMAQNATSAPLSDAGAVGTDTGDNAAKPDTAPLAARREGLAEADPSDDIRGNSAELYDAIRSGRWLAALAAGLLVAVFVVRKFLLKRVSWFQTRSGGWAVNFGLAALTAVAVEIRMGTIGLATILDALALGFTAAGVYEGVRDPSKRVAEPKANA